MKTKFIEIPEEAWGILFVYEFDKYDYQDIMAICKSFGMKEKSVAYSLNVLSTYNSGMTVSSDDLRMSAIFIGKSTSKGQFLNTIVHETAHAASAITSFYDKPCSGEDFAYLSGFIFQRIMEEIADIR